MLYSLQRVKSNFQRKFATKSMIWYRNSVFKHYFDFLSPLSGRRKSPPLLRSVALSLRLGHLAVLTPHRGVIHCRSAASLPLPTKASLCGGPIDWVSNGVARGMSARETNTVTTRSCYNNLKAPLCKGSSVRRTVRDCQTFPIQ